MHDANSVSLESALSDAESRLEAATKMVGVLMRELRRGRSAAACGQVRELRRGMAAAAEAAAALRVHIEDAVAAYDVDEGGLLSSGEYVKQLMAAADEFEVAMFEDDGQLLCYPSIVRVLPTELAVEIDRKRAPGIRPSVVVERLGRAQRAGSRFKPEPFLASLLTGYDLIVARHGKTAGAVVRLIDVYAVLTLLPRQSREYSRSEFARDLYLLDQSGIVEVGTSGRRLRWAASSGTRQAGVLTTVAVTGQQQRYWGIAFEEPNS